MQSALSIEEQVELARLLRKVAEKDGKFIPEPAYRPFHALVPWPAVEVLVHDEDGRFVLSHRDDDFKGWHIPGGYMRPGERYQDACDRNVRKEGIAQGVKDILLIGTHVWQEGEHPYGYPISLICACRPVGEVTEREGLAWFRETPEDIITQQHPRFLEFFRDWFRGRRMSAEIL